MNFLERFLPPSGDRHRNGESAAAEEERIERVKGLENEREREGGAKRAEEDEKGGGGAKRTEKYRERRGERGSGKENKRQAENGETMVALYRGIETEYVL